MKSLFNKVIVITGAGSGIGRQLAIKLAKEGAQLALSDINQKNLNETLKLANLTKANCLSQSFDVGSKDAFYAFAEAVEKKFGCAHCIINNAGVTVAESAEETSYDDFEWVMNINFWGVVYGTKAFIPLLKKADEACIVNISSVFGLFGFPSQSAYNSSKFAVRGFTEALRLELKDTQITPICVHPGGIRTNIMKNARYHSGVVSNQTHNEAMQQFERLARTSPEKAADVIINAIKKKKRRVLIGADATAYDIMSRLLPNHYDKLVDKLIKIAS